MRDGLATHPERTPTPPEPPRWVFMNQEGVYLVVVAAGCSRRFGATSWRPTCAGTRC